MSSQRTIRAIPAPQHISEGTSSYIAESIRRNKMLDEQQRILEEACAAQNIEPRYARRQLLRSKRVYRRDIERRIGSKPSHRFSRQDVITRDKSICGICGKTCERAEIHIDHIIPLALGGEHTLDNVRVTCATCNLRKGAGL